MFDVIGKRRWFYLFSLVITIPGLIFILLTPLTDAGLQFSIDYTGGTRWEIHFEDPNVTPDAGPGGLRRAGPRGASPSPDRLRLHRDQDRAARPARPGHAAVAGDRAAAPPSAELEPRQPASQRVRRAPVHPPARPRRLRAPRAPQRHRVRPHRPARRPRPPAPRPPATRQIPTEGKLGEVAVALEDEFGPIDEQRSLTTIGPVVSAELIRRRSS